MPVSATHIERAHRLRLFKTVLDLKENSSPLTLILDSLEQSAQPLTQEFMRAAKVIRQIKVIFVSFATVKKPPIADIFIKGRGKSLKSLAAEILSHAPNKEKHLILIDTLNPPSSTTPHLLPAFFSTIITPSSSLVAVYHTDVPSLPASQNPNEYAPEPLTLLCHLATTVLRVASLYQAILAKHARQRSRAEPEWGLSEGREGVLVGLRQWSGAITYDGTDNGEADFIVEMEMRRRSGRAVAERFVMCKLSGKDGQVGDVRFGPWGRGFAAVVMADHPEFRKPLGGGGEEEGGGQEMEATFDLGLTEKQRRDREGVVLPYFDAQVEVGGGEGGRILYEMGREDDFDEEEDEI